MSQSIHLPLHRIFFGLLLFALTSPLQAAPLNLGPPFPDPDITTSGAAIVYDYDSVTPSNGGVLTITGTNGSLVASNILLPDGSTAAISGSAPGPAIAPHAYQLTANFTEFGIFDPAGSSVSVFGYAVQPAGFGTTVTDPYYTWGNSGTILTLDLLEFGFQGTQAGSGDRDTVIFEWLGSIVGGDLFDLGFFGNQGGVSAAGNVYWGNAADASTPGSFGANVGDEWDPALNNNGAAFLEDFISCTSGCPLLLDTFVPIPAAVWLFFSGLLGLLGVSARRRQR